MPNVVTTSECGYAFHLTFCHSTNKNRYAQIISGYVPAKLISTDLTIKSDSDLTDSIEKMECKAG